VAGYNRFNKTSIIIFLALVLVTVSVVSAAEWMTFKGGFTRTSYTSQVIEVPVRKVLWTFNAGSAISCSPVINSGFIYFGTEGNGKGTFYCVNKNGKKSWEFPNDKLRNFIKPGTDIKPWPNGAMDFPRTTLKVSATVMNRRLYIPWGSMLLLVNVDSGKLDNYVDLKELGHQGSINTSPLVHDSHKLIICGSSNGYLYGFDIELREPVIRWRIPDGGSGGTISSSVAYSNRKIFFGSTSKKFYCYELSYYGADGVIAGQTPSLIWEKKLDGQITSTPAVSGNTVIVSTRDGTIYALSASTGDVIWKVNTGSRIDASPAISGSSVIAIAGKSVKCYNLSDGKQKWSSVVGNMCYATPIVNNEFAYVSCYDGKFYVFNISNGALRSAKKIGSPIKSSPSISSGSIYFGTQSGMLHALVSGDEPSKLQVTHNEINIPLVFNDEIFSFDEFFVENAGGGTLEGNITFSRNWVSTTSPKVKISADDGDQIIIRIDANGQVAGQYNIMMVIETNGGDKRIPIVINVVKRPDTIINLTIGSRVIKINSGPVTIEAPPWRTSSGIVMVPLRVITEAFGCTIRWIPETRTVMLIYRKKEITITINIGKQIAYIEYGNGFKTPVIMPYPPTIVKDRTFVPFTFMVQAFDAEIIEHGNNIMITIRQN